MLVGRRAGACRKAGGCLAVEGQMLAGRQDDVWLLTGRCLLEGCSGAERFGIIY